MITGIVGLPGEGKTLYASKQIRAELEVGSIVYSNIHVDDDDFIYYEDFKLLTKVQNGFIVLDEAQVYMNSRNWKSFPEEFQAFAQQHRHQGVDILALTQNLNRVDVTFRELVQELYQVEKSFIWSLGFLVGRFKLYELVEPPTGYEMSGDSSGFWAFEKDFLYYNTHSRKFKVLTPVLSTCTICSKEHMLTGWVDLGES